MHELAEPLLARTYRLLDIVDVSYGEIAAGAQVDKNWVAKFVTRSIDEPGVNKVQRVHDFLAARAAEQNVAGCELPNPSQPLGDLGNG